MTRPEVSCQGTLAASAIVASSGRQASVYPRADIHPPGQKIQKSPHAQRQVAALADVDRMHFLDVARIAVFEHRHQPAGGHVLAHLERGHACQPQPCQSETAQRFAVAGLRVAGHRQHDVLAGVPQRPAGLRPRVVRAEAIVRA